MSTITVLFFAQLAESAGTREIRFKAGDDARSVRELAEAVTADLPAKLSTELFDGTVLVAVNKRQADWSTQVVAGDEVAFLPPVSGG